MASVREWARTLKRQTLTLYYAVRDTRTPRYAKVLAGAIVAYAISPIDLIPDFIPVLGYLDELLLLPLAIWFALRLIPPDVLAEARARAEQASERPTSRAAAAVIVLVWLAVTALAGLWAYRYFAG
jgi:uncharacterized membrane protein YkvA (DUF1232 family)